MRGEDATQLSIAMDVKNRLDRFKADRKETIILKYGLKKRMITNTLAIRFLLDLFEESKRDKRRAR